MLLISLAFFLLSLLVVAAFIIPLLSSALPFGSSVHFIHAFLHVSNCSVYPDFAFYLLYGIRSRSFPFPISLFVKVRYTT